MNGFIRFNVEQGPLKIAELPVAVAIVWRGDLCKNPVTSEMKTIDRIGN